MSLLHACRWKYGTYVDVNLTELDMEYRYWGFIEGHPAHKPIPTETHKEAMDALQWSYTGMSI